MKIALIGYGRMGKEIEKIALSRGHEIVSIIDVDNQEDFKSDAFKSADVAIEFTKMCIRDRLSNPATKKKGLVCFCSRKSTQASANPLSL